MLISIPLYLLFGLVPAPLCPAADQPVSWEVPGPIRTTGEGAPTATYAYREVETGRIGPPPDPPTADAAHRRADAARRRATDPAGQALTAESAEPAVERPVEGPAGGVRLRLSARSRSGLVAVRDDGGVQVSCGEAASAGGRTEAGFPESGDDR